MPDLSQYGYNPKSRRYVDLKTGRFVPARDVRAAIDTVIDAETVKVRALSQRLVDGEMSLAEWQSQMAAQIKTLHVAMGVAAYGGFAAMTPARYGYLGSLIKKQYQYLRDFAAQIASGEQKLDGSLIARAALYSQAGRESYSDILVQIAQDGGCTQARRILGGADHCNGCVSEAARGWVPISDSLPIGAAECRSNCRCSQETR